jgi:hypothetical protein
VSDTLKGIAVMAVGVALLTANDAISKYLTRSHPVGQVICLKLISRAAAVPIEYLLNPSVAA